MCDHGRKVCECTEESIIVFTEKSPSSWTWRFLYVHSLISQFCTNLSVYWLHDWMHTNVNIYILSFQKLYASLIAYLCIYLSFLCNILQNVFYPSVFYVLFEVIKPFLHMMRHHLVHDLNGIMERCKIQYIHPHPNFQLSLVHGIMGLLICQCGFHLDLLIVVTHESM